MERTQFTFYESFFKAVSRIKKKADRAVAYDAICAYALYGTMPNIDEMPDAAAIAFELSKPNLDASRRKAAGGKKGTPSKDIEKIEERCGKDTANKKKKENKKEDKIENKCYSPPLPPSLGGGPGLQAVFEDWLAYKAERREAYKPTGLKSLVTQVQNAVKQHGEQAVADIIRTSMASNWAGIAFDRLRMAKPHAGYGGNVFLDMLREEERNGTG